MIGPSVLKLFQLLIGDLIFSVQTMSKLRAYYPTGRIVKVTNWQKVKYTNVGVGNGVFKGTVIDIF